MRTLDFPIVADTFLTFKDGKMHREAKASSAPIRASRLAASFPNHRRARGSRTETARAESDHVGSFPAAASQTCHEASADRVAGRRNHDWYSRRGSFGRNARQGTSGDDDINIQAYELGSDFAISTRVPVCSAIFDCNGAALEPTKLTQSLHETGDTMRPRGRRPCS